MKRGFGIAAAAGVDVAARVAARVEELGYSSVWTNDTPSADGLAVAEAMAGATASIRIGVGALPCDRRSPAEVAARVSSGALPPDRLVLVVGAGFASAPLSAAERAVEELRGAVGGHGPAVGLAAMGPGMCRLGGRVADLVLLNWMTPDRIRWARRRIQEGARDRSPDLEGAEVAAYVRAALGPGARELLGAEAAGYQRMPHYGRHFRSMGGEPGGVGVPIDDSAAHEGLLATYDAFLDETVIRALAPHGEAPIPALLAIARAAAP